MLAGPKLVSGGTKVVMVGVEGAVGVGGSVEYTVGIVVVVDWLATGLPDPVPPVVVTPMERPVGVVVGFVKVVT